MSGDVEGGAGLAWRLLATLEGGSLLLATSVLLAYVVTNKMYRQNRGRRNIRTVLVTNTTNLLGRELKQRLEVHGCVVETVDHECCDITGADDVNSAKVDAVVVVGAEPKADGIDGMANLVTEDIHRNLRVLETASLRLHDGGYIAWACTQDTDNSSGAFTDAGTAFDSVLRAYLIHIAKLRRCEAVWVSRVPSASLAAERLVDTLLARASYPHNTISARLSNAAHQIGQYVGRCLKIAT